MGSGFDYYVVCCMLFFNGYWYYDVEYIIMVDCEYSFCIFYEDFSSKYIMVLNEWFVYWF